MITSNIIIHSELWRKDVKTVKLSKYVKTNWIIFKYVKTCTYDKICKIKYRSFYQKYCETNLSLDEISLSCRRENLYLHINPSSNY